MGACDPEDTRASYDLVATEYARRLYDELRMGDRTEIEFFNGVHEIHGQGSFQFLHRHLNWPEK